MLPVFCCYLQFWNWLLFSGITICLYCCICTTCPVNGTRQSSISISNAQTHFIKFEIPSVLVGRQYMNYSLHFYLLCFFKISNLPAKWPTTGSLRACSLVQGTGSINTMMREKEGERRGRYWYRWKHDMTLKNWGAKRDGRRRKRKALQLWAFWQHQAPC